MLQIPMSPIWTSIVARVLRSGLSGSFSDRLDCGRCGSSYAVHVEGGTLSFVCADPRLTPWRSSRFRLSAAVTPDGKLSISCACSTSSDTEQANSGAPDGTSSIEKK